MNSFVMPTCQKSLVWDLTSKQGINEFYQEVDKWISEHSKMSHIISSSKFYSIIKNKKLKINEIVDLFSKEASINNIHFCYQDQKTLTYLLLERDFFS